eukprot:TRINITY_DN1573_c0_g1_i1.p1 TRINITY_DN1573_c0_g1~~TRINITY_DN1573_c0_g1_i1.p1  ORF type:complete len:270 (+),score=27.48 TRINITY_DN1573_c0_g1_i1:144-953(+)
MYCDLNIPTNNVTTLKQRIEESFLLGYRCIALETLFFPTNLTGKDAIPQPFDKVVSNDICPFHEIINFVHKKPFILHRITIKTDNPQHILLTKRKELIDQYSLVALQPLNLITFEKAAECENVDIIVFNFCHQIDFLKSKVIQKAIRKGIFIEVNYAPAIDDMSVRSIFFANLRNLITITERGRNNIILSSNATNIFHLRNPNFVINIMQNLGLSHQKARETITNNCHAVLQNAYSKRVVGGIAFVSQHQPIQRNSHKPGIPQKKDPQL